MQGNQISWAELKKLRNSVSEENKLDVFDIEKFYKFFKALYKTKGVAGEQFEQISEKSNCSQDKTLQGHATDVINGEVELAEVLRAVKGLKTGKAAGEDGLLNEFLKESNTEILTVITKLFNLCLKFGIYPWNTTLVSPLHKKGCPHDPDNYRAIAVGSNLGKLFSGILLSRLLEFRKQHCPDTPNQQGFCKEAQTTDHIFSLNTCIEKYVKRQRKRLYSSVLWISRRRLIQYRGKLYFINCKHFAFKERFSIAFDTCTRTLKRG